MSTPLNNNKKKHQTVNLPHKSSKLLLIKILIIIEIIKMILTIKVIVIITIIIITIIINCRSRYRTPAPTNTELLVILHNGRKPLSIIKNSSSSDAVRALYMPLKQLIHHVMNRGRPCPLNSLLGTLTHLISQE